MNEFSMVKTKKQKVVSRMNLIKYQHEVKMQDKCMRGIWLNRKISLKCLIKT